MLSVTFPGVFVQSDMKCSVHTESVCIKVSSAIFLLISLKPVTVDVLVSVLVYCAYIRCSFIHGMRYFLIFFINDSSVITLLIIQKKAIRVFAGIQSTCHLNLITKRLCKLDIRLT